MKITYIHHSAFFHTIFYDKLLKFFDSCKKTTIFCHIMAEISLNITVQACARRRMPVKNDVS